MSQDPEHRLLHRSKVIPGRPPVVPQDPPGDWRIPEATAPARRPFTISTPPPVGGVRRSLRRARPQVAPRSAIVHWYCTTLIREG